MNEENPNCAGLTQETGFASHIIAQGIVAGTSDSRSAVHIEKSVINMI
jgi:hypothetical protein